jgi:hypothetical protein
MHMGKTKKGKGKGSAKAPAVKADAKAVEVAATQDAGQSDRSEQSDGPFAGLHRLNRRLAISYSVQALALLLLSVSGALPVTAQFLGVDALASQANGGTVYAPASQYLFNLHVAQVLALSLAISGAFHGLYLYRANRLYETALRRRENPYRWLENAFSSSLLLLAIGLLAGLRDIASLGMLFVLGFVSYMLAWQYEQQALARQGQDARRSFVMLVITALAAWLAVGSYLLYGVLFGDGIPLFLGIAYGTALAGVIWTGWLLVRLRRAAGRWGDYMYAERMFSLSFFVIKTLLVWQLFAGALQP